jgi:hypothetical protein
MIFLLKIKLEYNIQSYNFFEIIRPISINPTTLINYILKKALGVYVSLELSILLSNETCKVMQPPHDDKY